MPPGSYLFWRIGMLRATYRWGLTAALCVGTALLWYAAVTRFFMCASPAHALHMQCATQLAELAACTDVDTKNAENASSITSHSSLCLLNLCDQHSLTVQVCSCSKPTKKANQTTQHVSLTCTGTLTQLHAFLLALAASVVPIANLHVTLKHQAHKSYLCILSYDYIIY